MKKHFRDSYFVFWLGVAVSVVTAFFSVTAAWVVLGAAIIQLFLFYRCPHCGYGLYHVTGVPYCCPKCGEDLD